MAKLSRTLKSTVFITSFFSALPALAQEAEVAPAPVQLDEEPDAAAAPPAQPAAAPAPAPTAAVSVGASTDAAATASGDAGGAVVLGGSGGKASQGGVDVGTGGWNFSYHGYFRAPFRMGIGKRDPEQRTGALQLTPATGSGPATTGGPIGRAFGPGYENPNDAYKKTTFHAPLIPDDQYLSWQATRHNQSDWAEMFFTVGNSVAEGTVSIEGFNFTQSSYSDPETQFGIAQGFVTIRPELPFQNVRLSAKVGSHWNRYGMAGRYDAGEYDTYQFGRTKVMGATLRQEVDVSGITLAFEEGFGGNRPHPSKYNTAKFTLLAHGHAFLQYQGLTAGLHFLHSWAQEEDRDGQGCPGPSGIDDSSGLPTSNGQCAVVWGAPYGTTHQIGSTAGFGKFADGGEGNVWLPDGSLTVLGPELKWDTGPFGLLYLGYSYMKAKNSLTVGPAMEMLHSYGGGQFSLGVTNNFLDNPQCNPAKNECSSGGNGEVHTIMFQHEFSLHNMLKMQKEGSRFWGEGWDAVLKLYAMYNQVKSDYDVNRDGTYGAKEPYGGVRQGARQADLITPGSNWTQYAANYWAAQGDNYSDHSKLKFGADLFGNFLPVMGAGVRFDRVAPNSNIADQTFMILSPRLEFRSKWVTREKITLQYSRYMYAQRECATMGNYNPYLPLSGSEDFDHTGSPQNFTGSPVNQECVQLPSGPRLPDGWGASSLETPDNWRGAPIGGGNPNAQRPDVNVVQISASMWW